MSSSNNNPNIIEEQSSVSVRPPLGVSAYSQRPTV